MQRAEASPTIREGAQRLNATHKHNRFGEPVKILHVDDHGLFRDGLKLLLADFADELRFTQAANTEQALQTLVEQRFNLILLDLGLPDARGLSTLDALLERCQGTPIIVVSAEEDPKIVREAVEHGAKAFIPKSFSQDVMTAILRLVLAGGTYLPPQMLLNVPQSVSDQHFENSVLAGLTDRQVDILRQVIAGKPNKIIARELNIAEATVKAHLAVAFRALGVKNRTQAGYAATQLGLSTET